MWVWGSVLGRFLPIEINVHSDLKVLLECSIRKYSHTQCTMGSFPRVTWPQEALWSRWRHLPYYSISMVTEVSYYGGFSGEKPGGKTLPFHLIWESIWRYISKEVWHSVPPPPWNGLNQPELLGSWGTDGAEIGRSEVNWKVTAALYLMTPCDELLVKIDLISGTRDGPRHVQINVPSRDICFQKGVWWRWSPRNGTFQHELHKRHAKDKYVKWVYSFSTGLQYRKDTQNAYDYTFPHDH